MQHSTQKRLNELFLKKKRQLTRILCIPAKIRPEFLISIPLPDFFHFYCLVLGAIVGQTVGLVGLAGLRSIMYSTASMLRCLYSEIGGYLYLNGVKASNTESDSL